MIDILVRLFNTATNRESIFTNQTELMKFFRAEYKNDAANAYDYWMSTKNTNYK